MRRVLTGKSELYPSLLGPAWEQLAPELRELHGRLPTALAGRLEISGGGGPAGRWLRRLAGMPTSNGEMEGRLDVRASGGREIWNRSFGRWCWRSAQWREGAHLVEQSGLWRVRFRLRVDQGQLHFEPEGVGLCLGRTCLPLPSLLAPKVFGRERAVARERVVARERAVDGTGEIETQVEVRTSWGWKVLTYGGRLHKVDP